MWLIEEILTVWDNIWEWNRKRVLQIIHFQKYKVNTLDWLLHINKKTNPNRIIESNRTQQLGNT